MEPDVTEFAALIEQHLGFHCEGARTSELRNLLGERLRTTGSADLAAYRARLSSGSARVLEQQALAERLTVGETYFFREPQHFDAFAKVVVPERLRRLEPFAPMRILSVGCSSGEEAYSLAIALRESIGAASERALVHGIDVNPGAIARARAARYSNWALRTTSDDLRQRYFRPAGAGHELVDEVRRAATFEVRNLFEEDPSFWRPGSFDVIVCRNVLIYFSQRRISSAIERLASALAPGGFLFLGHSEVVHVLPAELTLLHTHGTFCHVRREASGLPASPSGPDDAPPMVAVDSALPQPPPPHAIDRRAALDLFRTERFSEALALLDRGPPSLSTDAEMLLLRAVILTNQGKVASAEAACDAVLALDLRNASARYLLAMCRTQLGDTEAAAAHHRGAITIDPSFAMSHLQLGILARRRGDREAARAALHAALRLFEHEDAPTLDLLSGGFSRRALIQMCCHELAACGEAL